MNSKNSSTKKSVNRARKANGSGNNSRPSPNQSIRSRRDGNGGQGPSVLAPVARSRSQTTQVAKVTPIPNGVRVVNRELIGVVNPAAGFANSFRLRANPGSVATFVWLSTVALSFETYRFKKLHFQYIARAPTTVAGSVIISPDYDARDGVPATEQIQSAFKGTKEDAPWKDITMVMNPSEMNRAFKAHFTMDDTRFATTTQDVKTIDAGQCFVSSDIDASTKLGKLWVEYEVELFTPQTPSVQPNVGRYEAQFNSMSSNTTGTIPSFTGCSVTEVVRVPNDPIVANLALPGGGGNGTQALKFLRDFSGTLNYSAASASNFAGTQGSYSSSYIPTLNGVTVPTYVGVGPLGDQASGANLSQNLRGTVSLIAKAGDVLGFPNMLTSAAAVNGLNLILQGL